MKKSILVVDDSRTIRASASFCLRKAGYHVTEAKDGVDALEKLAHLYQKGRAPALIITDVNMPRMDGLSFIKEVKKGDLRFLPILVFTTESSQSALEKGKAAGAAGWLVKPFHAEQLLSAIKKLVWVR